MTDKEQPPENGLKSQTSGKNKYSAPLSDLPHAENLPPEPFTDSLKNSSIEEFSYPYPPSMLGNFDLGKFETYHRQYFEEPTLTQSQLDKLAQLSQLKKEKKSSVGKKGDVKKKPHKNYPRTRLQAARKHQNLESTSNKSSDSPSNDNENNPVKKEISKNESYTVSQESYNRNSLNKKTQNDYQKTLSSLNFQNMHNLHSTQNLQKDSKNTKMNTIPTFQKAELHNQIFNRYSPHAYPLAFNSLQKGILRASEKPFVNPFVKESESPFTKGMLSRYANRIPNVMNMNPQPMGALPFSPFSQRRTSALPNLFSSGFSSSMDGNFNFRQKNKGDLGLNNMEIFGSQVATPSQNFSITKEEVGFKGLQQKTLESKLKEDMRFNRSLSEMPEYARISSLVKTETEKDTENILKFGITKEIVKKCTKSLRLLNTVTQIQAQELWRKTEWEHNTRILHTGDNRDFSRLQLQQLRKAFIEKSREIKANPLRLVSNAKPKRKSKKRQEKLRPCVDCRSTRNASKLIYCKGCENAIHSFCLREKINDQENNWYCSNLCKQSSMQTKKAQTNISVKQKQKRRELPNYGAIEPTRLWEETDGIFNEEKLRKAIGMLKDSPKRVYRLSSDLESEQFEAHWKKNTFEESTGSLLVAKESNCDKSDKSDTIDLVVTSLISRRPEKESYNNHNQRKHRKKMRQQTLKYYESEGIDPLKYRPYITMRSLQNSFAIKKGYVLPQHCGFILPPQKYFSDTTTFGPLPKTQEVYSIKLLLVRKKDDNVQSTGKLPLKYQEEFEKTFKKTLESEQETSGDEIIKSDDEKNKTGGKRKRNSIKMGTGESNKTDGVDVDALKIFGHNLAIATVKIKEEPDTKQHLGDDEVSSELWLLQKELEVTRRYNSTLIRNIWKNFEVERRALKRVKPDEKH